MDLAKETVPGLLIFDMLLPKTSEPKIVRLLRSESVKKGIPVVDLSGLLPSIEPKLKDVGTAGYCEKSRLCIDRDSKALLGRLANLFEPQIPGISPPGQTTNS